MAGMVGGTVGKLICHPIDTVKAKIQVQTNWGYSSVGSIRSIASATVRAEGIRGLYRGLGISLTGSIPASALYFGSYEWFKMKAHQNGFLKSHPNLCHLAGGMFAETIACVLFVPIDVIKERRQVQSSLKTYAYKSDRDAIRQIAKTEGLRGMYRAYGATVFSFGPFSALYFMFYEKFKLWCTYWNSYKMVMAMGGPLNCGEELLNSPLPTYISFW